MAYTDPRAGLPLSPLMQRAFHEARPAPLAKPSVTEIRKAVTEIKSVTEKRRGRPKANGLSAAERMRKMRAKTKCPSKAS